MHDIFDATSHPVKILCIWHVLRAWEGHLKPLPANLQTEMLEQLRAILHTPNKDYVQYVS